MADCKYRPLFGRVVIERQVTAKTKGGIIIPDNQQKRMATANGTIVALGETAGLSNFRDEAGEEKTVRVLKLGDKVIFGRHAGSWLDSTYSATEKDDEAKFFICQDEDILAVEEAA